jgi:membrane protein
MWQVLKETVSEWQEDQASQLAAALAYYTVVSIAPLLVLVVVLVGLIYGRETAQAELMAQVSSAVGEEGAQFLRIALENAAQPTLASVAGILSFLVLLWGSTNVFSQLQNSLNAIWGVKHQSSGFWGTLKDRFLAFLMVLGVALLLLVSLVISAVLSALANADQAWLPGLSWLWQLLNFALSFGIITLLFAAIYKVLPDAQIAWRDTLLGAAVTALLFVIGQFLLSFYLGNAGSAYGAVGSLVVFLLWLYYSAQIFFFGAEFTQVYARHYGAGIQSAEQAA